MHIHQHLIVVQQHTLFGFFGILFFILFFIVFLFYKGLKTFTGTIKEVVNWLIGGLFLVGAALCVAGAVLVILAREEYKDTKISAIKISKTPLYNQPLSTCKAVNAVISGVDDPPPPNKLVKLDDPKANPEPNPEPNPIEYSSRRMTMGDAGAKFGKNADIKGFDFYPDDPGKTNVKTMSSSTKGLAVFFSNLDPDEIKNCPIVSSDTQKSTSMYRVRPGAWEFLWKNSSKGHLGIILIISGILGVLIGLGAMYLKKRSEIDASNNTTDAAKTDELKNKAEEA